jgi:hypothetical protein
VSAWHPDGRDLAVVIPMLGRPHTVAPLAESIRATVPAAQIVWALSAGDTFVDGAVAKVGGAVLHVPYQPVGDYARKINAGYRATTQPLIFCGACDLRFHPGWYRAAVDALTPGVGVVGTNDLGSPRVIAGDHSTHSLVTRDYADRHGTVDGPGAILAEVYPHEFVDDEFVETAKHRRAFAAARAAHVEHLHPNWNRAIPVDGLYLGQRARMVRGRPIYQARRNLWT